MISRRHMLKLGATACILPTFGARADELTVTFGSAATNDQTYDPRVTLSRNEEQVIVQLFDQLIAADNDGKLYPGLARSWQLAPDFRSITLQLRDDVTFHDGTKFDAAAVQFTFDTIIDPKTGSMGAIDIIGPYEGADILGRHEIRLRYRAPFPRAEYALTDNKASIVSPAAVGRLADTGFGQAPVGTGPFRFVSWEKGRAVTMARNPDYVWGPSFMPPGPPRIARLIHRFVPNPTTRVAALDAGEIDISEQTPPLDTKRMSATGKFRTLIGAAAGLPFGFSLNSSQGPFADIKVRQAFIASIDRQWMSQNLFFGLEKPVFGPLASSIPEYWPGVEAYYPFDPAAAAKLLDEAGWHAGKDGIREKDGRRLAIYLPIFIEPEIGVVIQANARQAGFDVRIEQVTRQKQDELMYGNGYDMLSQRWSYNDASVLEIPFLSRNVPAPGRYSFNWSRYADPALDKVLTDAAVASPDARGDLYIQAQKMIMDAAIFLPIHEQTQTIVHRREIGGLRAGARQLADAACRRHADGGVSA